MTLVFPARPTKTHTQEVTEWWIQHPEEQQELSQLPLHCLLTLLKVAMLGDGDGGRGEGHVKGWTPILGRGRGPVSHPSPEPHHKFHEATETPERIHLILNDVEDRGEKITHALDIAWGVDGIRTRPRPSVPSMGRPCPQPHPWCHTEVKVVHAVGEENVIQQAQPWVVGTLIKLVAPVCAAHISLCGDRVWGAR